MEDNDIDSGVMGIMHDHRIVYVRGFGWMDPGHATLLQENAMMRYASITKPVTSSGS